MSCEPSSGGPKMPGVATPSELSTLPPNRPWSDSTRPIAATSAQRQVAGRVGLGHHGLGALVCRHRCGRDAVGRDARTGRCGSVERGLVAVGADRRGTWSRPGWCSSPAGRRTWSGPPGRPDPGRPSPRWPWSRSRGSPPRHRPAGRTGSRRRPSAIARSGVDRCRLCVVTPSSSFAVPSTSPPVPRGTPGSHLQPGSDCPDSCVTRVVLLRLRPSSGAADGCPNQSGHITSVLIRPGGRSAGGRADSLCAGSLGDNGAVTSLATTSQSAALFARALDVTPGGVNSPVRAFRAVGGTPRFMASGTGPYVYDVDGTEYVDLVCSWGPLILGHAHPAVVDAVSAAVRARHVVRDTVHCPRSSSPRRSSRGRRSTRCGSSRPAPRRPCRRSGWPAASPAVTWS